MKQSPDRRRQRRITLATCCGVHGLQDGLTATVYVLLPIIGQHFGLSYGQVGFIRAAHGAAMSLLEFPASLLSERFGERRLLVFGLACGACGYFSLSVAGGYGALIGALFLAGVGAAFQHSLCSSLITTAFDAGGRRTALGAYNSSGDVGKLAATGTMSALVGMGLKWQDITVGYGVLTMSAAVAVGWTLYRFAPRTQAADPAAARHKKHSPGLKDRSGFVALAAIVFLDTAVQDGFLVFVAFLMLEKQVPAGLAAFAVVLTLLGGIVGKFGCGVVADRIGVTRSLVAVQLLTALGLVGIYYSSALVAYCLLPLVGVFLQGSTSISYGTVGDLVEADRGPRGFAIVYSMSALAGILAPVAFGLTADRFGLGSAVLAMSVTVLMTLPLCLILEPALRRVHSF